MNRRKVLRLLIAVTSILAVVIAESFIDPNVASAQNGCSASSQGGKRTCSITCPQGTFPKCKGGLFGAKCTCHSLRGADVWPLPDPPVLDQERECAERLRAYLLSIGSAEAVNLANIIALALEATMQQDEAMYSDAENSYVAAMESASEELQSKLTAWTAANPDCVWSKE